MGRIKTLVLGVLGMFCAVLLLGGGEASAAMPWWHVNTVFAPAQKAGGEGTVQVEVSNLGDAPTEGTFPEHKEEALKDETNGFIKLVEVLPAGLTVSEAKEPVIAEGNGTEEARHSVGPYRAQLELLGKYFAVPKLCSVSGQTVTCLDPVPVRPYERVDMIIPVLASPGSAAGVNEVRVSGGGATPVVSKRTISPDEQAPSFGVENYEIQPEEEGGGVDTQAGSHPFQLTTTLALNTQTVQALKITHRTYEDYSTGESGTPTVVPEVQPLTETKDLRFNIPPGLIGNPQALPKCSLAVFVKELSPKAERCPASSVIGVSEPIVTGRDPRYNDPLILSSPLVNLEPDVGEPARFGFQTAAGPVILDTSIRTGGDYGVTVTVPNIINIPFLGSQVTFWGVPGDPRHDGQRTARCLEDIAPKLKDEGSEISCPAGEKEHPFLIMPTACEGPLQSSVEGDSWSSPGAFTGGEYTLQTGPGGDGETYGLDGCNHLSFAPSISLTPDGQQASSPTGLTVGVHVAQDASLNPTGLADSTVRDTTVTLPAGIAINPAGADGLQACGLGEIALQSPEEQSCPEASKIGTVEIRSPLLPNPLQGAAYLATQNANPFGTLVAMYLVAYDPVSGVRVKLAGEVNPDPVTGQLVSSFKNTPQLPFEDLKLHFFGGSRAPLGTPALCGGYTTTASIAPWSGTTPVGSSSEFQITSGPNGSPCFDPLPFAPSLTGGSSNLQAGAFTPFVTTMSREDGNQNLQSIQMHMPPGLSGLLSGVTLCGEAQANAGTCGPDSLIGETIVSVGLGGNPYSVTGGKVYITGPYKGAPFGLSIVNPAKAGPYDLGQVIVRAKIEVDPHTAALTITTDNSGPYAIPHILDGIPLQIKHVNVAINRPGFTFNPTSCSPMAITGSLQSTEGTSRALSVPFQVTNCATLKFQPKFTVSTSGKTSKASGASLAVKLTYPNVPEGTDANIARVKVDLPKQLPSRLTTLQKACTNAQFEANPAGCPGASIIGHAKAITPLLPVPLEGPAIFVSHGGEAFPSLEVVLQGYGVTIDLVGTTFISKTGITSSTFKTVPDQPIGSFELTLPEGKYSALAANGNLCTSKLAMPTEFLAQNGAKINESTPISITGCPNSISISSHKVKGKTTTIQVSVPAAGKLIATGKGLSKASKTASGRETVSLVLNQKKAGKLKTKIKLTFTPSKGAKQSKNLTVEFKR